MKSRASTIHSQFGKFVFLYGLLAVPLLTAPARAAVIAAGEDHSLGLSNNGSVVGWGRNEYGQRNGASAGFGNVAVAAGLYHSLALKNDGTVVGWGFNGQGRANGALAGSDNVAVAAGGDHSLALKGNGTVVGWGWNDDGRANGALAGNDNVAIAAGFSHSLSLKSDGTVVGWGDNQYGQTNGVSAGNGNITIAAGFYHSLALKSDGTVVGWGGNEYGQADGALAGTDNVAVAAGWIHNLALKSDGTVIGWGYNGAGQADGTLAGGNVVAIVAGRDHSLALKSNGTVIGWGRNIEGQTSVPAGLTTPTLADWINPAGGNFLGSYNWRYNTPSTAASDARFGIDGTYTVQFNTNARARNIEVASGNVTFDLNDFTYRVEETLSVANARLNLKAGTLEVLDSTNIQSTGIITGSGTIKGNVVNAGRIEVGPDRFVTAQKLSSSDSKSYHASFLFEGDFTQSATGTISVQDLTQQHRLSPTGTHSTAMLVTGTATLDGKLEVGFADGYTPNIGDRFALITAKEIKGKIATFENAIIDDAPGRFLGLNYRTDTNAGRREVLELITLEAPRGLPSPESAKRNLVLITHGTNATADEWVTQLRDAINNHAHSNWDVVALDWSNYNGGPESDPFRNRGPLGSEIVLGVGDPYVAANNGINIGQSLVRLFQEQGRTFDSVHLLGHSSGSWLVDAIADSLYDASMADRIHLTLFDAFTPPNDVAPKDVTRTAVSIGDTADFAEHYFHQHPVVQHTDRVFPLAVNFDLTALQDFPLATIAGIVGSHAYPYRWYLETAQNPGTAILGFPLSEAYGGVFPSYGPQQLLRGKLIEFRSDGGIELFKVDTHPINLNDAQLNVTTGNVEIFPDGSFIAKTESPAILTSLHEFDFSFSAFEFDFNFLSEAPGLLSVYFDGEQVFEFDSSLFGLGPDDTLNSGWIWLGEEYEPGPYSITFRLDPLGDEQASIQIDNLQFISLELIPIPEPTSVGAAILGLAFAAVVARRRKTSAESDTPQLAA